MMFNLNFDLDGVIADIVMAVMKIRNTYIDYESLTEYHHPLMHKVWDMLDTPLLYEVMEIYPGAGELLRELKTSGYNITVATNRPESARLLTKQFLSAHNIPFDSLLFMADKSKSGPHLLVEDNIDNAIKYAIEVGPALLIDHPWNRAAPKTISLIAHPLIRCHNWDEVRQAVRSLHSAY